MQSSGGFGGQTRIWTTDGLRRLDQMTAHVYRVFCQRNGVYGWHEAAVTSAGSSPLLAVEVGRGSARRVFYAAPQQNWLIPTRANEDRTAARPVLTTDLAVGDRLLAVHPRSRLAKITPSPFGIAAGVVFGEGHAPAGRTTSEVTLYGDKQELARYFTGCSQTTGTTNGLPVVTVHSLPRFLKAAPSLDEAASYLYGWLAGYFATDGTIDERGRMSISSAQAEHLELAQTIAVRLGIGVGDVLTYERVGFRQTEPSRIHRLQLTSGSVKSDFFIRQTQATRWRNPAPWKASWVVREVRDLSITGDIYTLPAEVETAVLDGFVAARV